LHDENVLTGIQLQKCEQCDTQEIVDDQKGVQRGRNQQNFWWKFLEEAD